MLKASYEGDNGEDEDQHDKTDNLYFTMKDGDNFFTAEEESNENQEGADGDNGQDEPVEALEDGMYLGEEMGICNEEEMIQDEINVMRSSVEEDTEPSNMMHESVRTESAVLIEAKSAVQV